MPGPKRKSKMPLTVHIRLPVTEDEHNAVAKLAGDMPITAYLRKILGLPPRKAGRPSHGRKLSK